jgi:CubicO group peptidase (beta-lactamase class C family)
MTIMTESRLRRTMLGLLAATLALTAFAVSPAQARRHRRTRRGREHHFSGYLPKEPIVRLDGRRLKPAEIDSIVVRLMRSAGVPGLGIALLHEGRVAYAGAYGWRDRDASLPMTERTEFCGASLTKGVVAVAAVQMDAAGTLPLDRPLTDVVPGLRSGSGPFGELAADPRDSLITPRLLLSHRSGLANLRGDEPDRLLRLHFTPGSRFAYSGEGFELLQAGMEAAAGESLQAVVAQRVFAPLGMWRSGLTWNPHFDDDVATGYDEDGRAVGTPRPRTADAAGSLSTTLSDYARLMAALLGGKVFQPRIVDVLLARQADIASAHEFPTLDSLDSPATRASGLGYALGWGLIRTPKGEAFFKEGHAVGFRHYAVGFRDSGDGLVVLCNSANGEAIFAPLLEQLLADTWTPVAWHGWPPPGSRVSRPALPPPAPSVALPSDALARYAGSYRFPPDITVVMRVKQGGLSMQENDEPAQDLLPESRADFRSASSSDHWTFESDSTGRVVAVVLHLGTRDVRLTRTD